MTPAQYTTLFESMAGRPLGAIGLSLGTGGACYCGTHGVDTPLRLAHWLAQSAHESGLYRYFREIWGPTAAQSGYEGRAELGNTHPGDGHRYLGRGLLQITGRANYREAGERLALPLEASPALAERPDIAVATACDFWARHGLAALADSDDVQAVTRRINGGLNGLADRAVLTIKAKHLLHLD